MKIICIFVVINFLKELLKIIVKTNKNKKDKKNYPSDIDKEVINLCNAINEIDGLQTTESCCGHGKEPFMIFFDVTRVKALPTLLYYLRHYGDNCHAPNTWFCEAYTDCGGDRAMFVIMSVDIGEEAYKQADEIAKCIREDLAESKKDKK